MIEITLELQQFPTGKDLVDRHLLRHIPQQTSHRAGIVQGIQASHPHAAGIGGQQGGQDPQRGGFASTIRPQQPIKTAFGHLEREIAEGGHCPVGLLEMSQLQQGHCDVGEGLEWNLGSNQ